MVTDPAWQASTQEPSLGRGRTLPSMGVLLRSLVEELSILLRQELALAAAELSTSVDALKTGVGSVATGGAVVFAGFLTLLAAAVLGLSHVLPAWLSALLIGVVVVAIGGLMLLLGKHNLSIQRLKPKRTPTSLRRDSEVLTRKVP